MACYTADEMNQLQTNVSIWINCKSGCLVQRQVMEFSIK